MSVDPLAHKYPNISPYAFVANSPIIFIDSDGREIDLSKLTPEQQKTYNDRIKRLKASDIFNYYYSYLENSDMVYYIEPGGYEKSEKTGETGGAFVIDKEKGGGSVRVGKFDAYVIAQELFHAFQTELDVYDNLLDKSVIETEGDLASYYVVLEAGLPFISNIGENWSDAILLKYDDGFRVPSATEIESEEYQKLFVEATDKRIDEYKKKRDAAEKEKEGSGYLFSGYTMPNWTKNGPKALLKAKQESETKNNVGPRMENGDFYSN